jgi:hypothetical protein
MDVRLSIPGLTMGAAAAGWTVEAAASAVFAAAGDDPTMEDWLGRFVSLRGGTVVD